LYGALVVTRHVMTPYKLYYLLFNNVPITGAGMLAEPRTKDFLVAFVNKNRMIKILH